ncbi:beta-lactamase/transpeptidase-like protein [Aspergillus pseudodeflectus]|uniref:Beta-lactamase/transpeptidase-like protein n=1 Tax=Aspergillus pseudodeflectus TaxID=176178 RepID=A0ABR4JRM8_9EURO
MGSTTTPEQPFERLEQAFLNAIEDGTWPGAVVAATNVNGTFHYAKAFGKDTCDSNGKLFEMDSIMAIASMTKLLTTIAALQLVEKKLIGLDDDVTPWVPTLADQEVLDGWDEAAGGRPRTHRRKNKITLRNLLTHSSGAGYDMSNPDLARFTAYMGREVNSGATVDERFGYPLLFEPGIGWEYGTGMDWVGQVIERRTGQTLEVYMQKHIWEPLGIERMSFWPGSIPDADKKRARMSVRDPVSGWPISLEGPVFTEGVTDCFGGQGLYASMEDFLKVLHSILADDGRLLSSQSTAMMFQPQLGEASRESLQRHLRASTPSSLFVGIFDNTLLYDWGLGGMLCMEDAKTGRRKQSLFWSGAPNLFWFINREADLCGVLGTQILPPCDPRVANVIELFESSVFTAREELPGGQGGR